MLIKSGYQIQLVESRLEYLKKIFLVHMLRPFFLIVRQYTRKVIKNSTILKKTVVKYVFDIIPKNIVAFRFYRSTKTMRVVVKGYCLRQ